MEKQGTAWASLHHLSDVFDRGQIGIVPGLAATHEQFALRLATLADMNTQSLITVHIDVYHPDTGISVDHSSLTHVE